MRRSARKSTTRRSSRTHRKASSPRLSPGLKVEGEKVWTIAVSLRLHGLRRLHAGLPRQRTRRTRQRKRSTWFRRNRSPPPKARSGDFFVTLPEFDRTSSARASSNRRCSCSRSLNSPAHCGLRQTACVRLASQLFGDRMIVANATAPPPSTEATSHHPWAKNNEGRGPSWSNSLFEDNANSASACASPLKHTTKPRSSMNARTNSMRTLVSALKNQEQNDEAGIKAQRENVES